MFVMHASLCGLSFLDYNRYNYSENEMKAAANPKLIRSALNCKIKCFCVEPYVFPVMSSVFITSEYRTIIYFYARFDAKTLIVYML